MFFYTPVPWNSTAFSAVVITTLHFGHRLLWTWSWQP